MRPSSHASEILSTASALLSDSIVKICDSVRVIATLNLAMLERYWLFACLYTRVELCALVDVPVAALFAVVEY